MRDTGRETVRKRPFLSRVRDIMTSGYVLVGVRSPSWPSSSLKTLQRKGGIAGFYVLL